MSKAKAIAKKPNDLRSVVEGDSCVLKLPSDPHTHATNVHTHLYPHRVVR